MILQAVLVGLAALLSAWVLPPGGVVWRLPPELTHNFGAIAQAHVATVVLADAGLALIIDLVGMGHILGQRAGLPWWLRVSSAAAGRCWPRRAWQPGYRRRAIDLQNALLGAVSPSTLAGWDATASGAGQGGLVGPHFKLILAVLACCWPSAARCG